MRRRRVDLDRVHIRVDPLRPYVKFDKTRFRMPAQTTHRTLPRTCFHHALKRPEPGRSSDEECDVTTRRIPLTAPPASPNHRGRTVRNGEALCWDHRDFLEPMHRVQADLLTIARHARRAVAECDLLLRNEASSCKADSGSTPLDLHRDALHLRARLEGLASQVRDTNLSLHRLQNRLVSVNGTTDDVVQGERRPRMRQDLPRGTPRME